MPTSPNCHTLSLRSRRECTTTERDGAEGGGHLPRGRALGGAKVRVRRRSSAARRVARRSRTSGRLWYRPPAPRVIETGVYAKAGHASGPDWLAAVSGSSAGAARARLAAAERAALEPDLARPFRDGTLSAPELKVLSDAAVAAPESLPSLVSLATGESSYKELTDAAQEATCSARLGRVGPPAPGPGPCDPALRLAPGRLGGIRGEFLCDEVAWARVAPASKPRPSAAGWPPAPSRASR